MSIPGLGQIAPQPATSNKRIILLKPLWEYRFSVPRNSPGVGVRLLTGTADRDGTELALSRTYTFQRTRSKISTYQGCTLEISGGPVDDYVKDYADPSDSPACQFVNLHIAFQELREAAAARQSGRTAAQGPRVMVCGPRGSGKTTLARTLVALAARVGGQPLMANVDPDEGLLALPGTVSAAVYGTMMDIEEPAGGFGIGSTPSSGPNAVPVKLPIVYYFGRERVEDDVPHWKDVVSKLASSARAKLKEDEAVRAAGMFLDTPPVDLENGGVDILAHAASEFAGENLSIQLTVLLWVEANSLSLANFILVLGSDQLVSELQRHFAGQKTSLGEPIMVVPLDKSDGVVQRDEQFMRFTREATIKEYFFGDSKRTLSPSTQSVSFDDVAIFKAPDGMHDLGLIAVGSKANTQAESEAYEGQPVLEPAEISAEMSHWTLAIMNASVNDPPETIRQAPVIGFIAIADVDEDRRRLKVLSPVSGRLGNKPLVWGRWPEPYINLLG
ncbi:Pre-mRNA cleavage complex II protein Clp1-domain-containing protein [Lasiosphaeris hirsuta]|uniref:Polynucleotide 5'-hydroxyl-kinase GRC3 n=1 Tax=Lasiosphaeris hirsuta TaxID=260670 RepID=A0AA40AG38_9PEZI|nr:Pre-mRNA cleavage complex II protein Clp1-domain-containing protein [Lasiosphaeris hirsuta]